MQTCSRTNAADAERATEQDIYNRGVNRDAAWAGGLAIASFAFYAFGAYPSVSYGDSGELITAAYSLGIPHAPGFPSYSILAHAFQNLVAWGSVAYRTNLFSAFCSCMTVALLFAVLRRRGARLMWAVACAAVFALSHAFMVSARSSEVFALNALAAAGMAYAVACERWALAAFLGGVGAANHQIAVFLLPGLLLAAWGQEPGRMARLGAMAGAFMAGLGVYGLLPLRAVHDPFLNIGNPSSWDGFWRVVRRADYGTLTLALGETPPRAWSSIFLQLKRLGLGLLESIPWPLFLPAALIFHRNLKDSLVRFLFLGFLLIGPGFFLLGNLPFDAQSDGLLVRFYIVPSLLCACLTGQLGASLSRSLASPDARHPVLRSLGGASLFLLGTTSLVWQAARADVTGFRHDFTALAYGRNTLRSLPHEARFFMDGGDDTFYTTMMLTQVEGRRRDVVLHDRGGFVFRHPYGDDFRRLDKASRADRRLLMEQLLAKRQPIVYSTMDPDAMTGMSLQQAGLVYRTIPGQPFWPLYDLRGVPPWHHPPTAAETDYRTRALLPFYAYQAGVDASRQDRLESALGFWQTAWKYGKDVLWLKPNLVQALHLYGYRLATQGAHASAMRLYRQILKLNPADPVAQKNVAELNVLLSRHGP